MGKGRARVLRPVELDLTPGVQGLGCVIAMAVLIQALDEAGVVSTRTVTGLLVVQEPMHPDPVVWGIASEMIGALIFALETATPPVRKG